MNTHLPLERADSYFNAEWRDSRSPFSSKPAQPFVTISRESGSGGSSLAHLLAKKFNGLAAEGETWDVFAGNVITRMLQTNHLPDNLARFLPEDRVPEINASIGELVGLHPSLWDLMQKTNETMRQLATGGHVILVGRGANFATAGIGRGVHVRLIAPPEHRAAYFAQLYHITHAAALAHIAKCDAARRRYVSANFNADVDHPAAYDLVINTAHVPLADAVELVAARTCKRTPVAA